MFVSIAESNANPRTLEPLDERGESGGEESWSWPLFLGCIWLPRLPIPPPDILSNGDPQASLDRSSLAIDKSYTGNLPLLLPPLRLRLVIHLLPVHLPPIAAPSYTELRLTIRSGLSSLSLSLSIPLLRLSMHRYSIVSIKFRVSLALEILPLRIRDREGKEASEKLLP